MLHKETTWGFPLLEKIDSSCRVNRIPNASIAFCDDTNRADIFYVNNSIADNAGSIKANETTKFQLGSVSKFITCSLFCELELRGFLRLDDPLPDLINSAVIGESIYSSIRHSISWRHLLCHRAGFKDRGGFKGIATEAGEHLEINKWCADFSNIYDRDQVGSFHYSSFGYLVAQIALEKMMKESFDNLLQRWICRPLGMDYMSCNNPHKDIRNIAKGHTADGYLVKNGWNKFTGCEAAAGIWSSASDMGILISHLLNIKEEPVSTDDPMIRFNNLIKTPKSWKYKLGVREERMEGSRVMLHTGVNPGYYAAVLISPGCGKGVAVLTNMEDAGDFTWALLRRSQRLMVGNRAEIN